MLQGLLTYSSLYKQCPNRLPQKAEINPVTFLFPNKNGVQHSRPKMNLKQALIHEYFSNATESPPNLHIHIYNSPIHNGSSEDRLADLQTK